MAVYQYTHGSLLNEVQILTNETGGKRAYMHARENATSEELRAAKQALRARGLQCLPIVQDGKPMLEVRGFSKNEEFLDTLGQIGLISGAPSKVVADPSDKRTLLQKAKSNTLQLTGWSYNIGDAAYMYYTTMPAIKNWKGNTKSARIFDAIGVLSGIGYGLGSLCLTFFGAKDQSVNNIKTSTTKIERFARKEGYEIPDESSIAYVNAEPKRGFFEKIKATIARYPSEALNTIYIGVGLGIASVAFYRGTRPIASHLTGEALLHAKKENKNQLIDVGLGAVTAGSALVGIAVKETKRMPGDPKRSGIGGFVDWIREKPLRATGYGYMIATAWHGYSTWGHWKDKTEPRRYLIGRAIFIGANVLSEILLTVSSKGHGVGVKPDPSVDDSVMATAAELVLRQPPEKRETVIRQLAGYMASPEVLATKADDVEKQLRVHLDLLDNNPWTRHFVGHAGASLPASEPAAAIAAPEPAAMNSAVPSTKVSSAHHAAMLTPAAQSQAVH